MVPLGPRSDDRASQSETSPHDLSDWTLLAPLEYQPAAASGYGMRDDFKLGMKNVKQIFGKSRPEARRSFVETLDLGAEATI